MRYPRIEILTEVIRVAEPYRRIYEKVNGKLLKRLRPNSRVYLVKIISLLSIMILICIPLPRNKRIILKINFLRFSRRSERSFRLLLQLGLMIMFIPNWPPNILHNTELQNSIDQSVKHRSPRGCKPGLLV